MQSSRKYAIYQQYGTRTIPARPFVPALGAPGGEKLTPAAEKAICDVIGKAFAAAAMTLNL